MKVNESYAMALDGFDGVEYATSADGLRWVASPVPLVTSIGSQVWVNGSVSSPSLLYDGSEILLWYQGSSGNYGPAKNYVAGIAEASCGFFLLSSTRTVSTNSTVTVSTVATATSTFTSVQVLTTTAYSTLTKEGQSAFDYASAAVLGAGVTLAALAMLRFAARRAPK